MTSATEWRSLKSRIESLKEAVEAEIRSYPPPIPACDAQYNHLLELRRLLPQELRRLERAAETQSGTVDDFIRSSLCQEALSEMRPED